MESVESNLHGDIATMAISTAGSRTATASPVHPSAVTRWAIQTAGLTKTYGARRAVDAADLAIPAGMITGFVGPNGAGKTTTLRMLLGLIRPTAGTGTVLDGTITHPEQYMDRVGALIEGPAFHPQLSGRRNLEALAVLGGIPQRRVAEVLEMVELTDRSGDLYRAYSLGMKQRLGVAAALLPNPELLVLDEPVNGLDPAGIIETRALLRRLREQGITVFVSSHLLTELEQVADWIVLIQDGRIRFQGAMGELLASSRTSLVLVPENLDDLDSLATIARNAGHAVELDGRSVRVADGQNAAAEMNRVAMRAGITLVQIAVERSSLEDTFLAMTGDD
jgi:ABC-2 type transport system ATP-binding protein